MTKKEIIKYLKAGEMDVQSARALPFICYMAFLSYVDSRKVHKADFAPVFWYMAPGNTSFYQIIAHENLLAATKNVYNEYLKNKKSLDKLIGEHKKITKEIDNLWRDYKSSKISLKEAYKKSLKAARIWWRYAAIGEDKGEIINTEIIPCFAKRHNLNINKARDIFPILAHPKEQTVFNLERISFLKICLLYSKQPDIKELDKLITAYLKNFFWIKSDWCKIKNLSEKDLIEAAKKELSLSPLAEIKKEIKEINDNFKEIYQKQKILKKKLKLSKRDATDIKFARTIISWIDYRKAGMMRHLYYICALMEDISKALPFEYTNLSYYNPDELEALLFKKIKLSGKIIQKRKPGAFVVFNNRKQDYFFGNAGEKLFNIATHTDELKFLKGTIACKGKNKKVIGKASIVKNPLDANFEKDDILVASMTRVEFLPCMRKAKAIITNEGGIACHAAIVSRELGIPCIIGTKSATQVLKDGDMVEMDMDNGEIKILKNKSN